METKEFFNRCLGQANNVVSEVSRDDFSNATPDTEWDVQQLLNHMLYELSWVSEVVSGKTIAQVGDKYDGDLTEGDFRSTWKAAAIRASDAVQAADLNATAHLSFGDFPNEYYIRQVSGELLVHGWDLSKGINKPLKFDPDLAEELYRQIQPRAQSLQSSGMFKPIVKTAQSDDLQTKVLALYGRDAKV